MMAKRPSNKDEKKLSAEDALSLLERSAREGDLVGYYPAKNAGAPLDSSFDGGRSILHLAVLHADTDLKSLDYIAEVVHDTPSLLTTPDDEGHLPIDCTNNAAKKQLLALLATPQAVVQKGAATHAPPHTRKR